MFLNNYVYEIEYFASTKLKRKEAEGVWSFVQAKYSILYT